MQIKNKIVNHFILSGEKKTSEKILLKSFKELQKVSKNQPKKLLKIALVWTTPIFRTYKKRAKNRKKLIKEFPILVVNKKTRVSLAIKFILMAVLENKKINNCYMKLYKSIFFNTKLGEGIALETKNKIQKQALLKKQLF